MATQGIPYQYKSIMHPKQYSYARADVPTIVPTRQFVGRLGSGDNKRPTQFDYLHINLTYCKGYFKDTCISRLHRYLLRIVSNSKVIYIDVCMQTIVSIYTGKFAFIKSWESCPTSKQYITWYWLMLVAFWCSSAFTSLMLSLFPCIDFCQNSKALKVIL